MQYQREALTTLYRTWLAANPRVSPTRLGEAITGGKYERLVGRLLRGDNLTSEHCRMLSVWINDNWPAWLAWPPTVPRDMGSHFIPAETHKIL